MVHEDIEELKKFGKEIQHPSNHMLPKYTASTSTNVVRRTMTITLDRLYSFICFVPTELNRQGKKVYSRIKQSLRQFHLHMVHEDPSSHPPYRKDVSVKQVTRLIETKKQIGDITIIIRKRIEVPFNSENDLNHQKAPSASLSYFFYKRSMIPQKVEKRYRPHESLFDVPMPLYKQRPSLAEKMKLFFLRL